MAANKVDRPVAADGIDEASVASAAAAAVSAATEAAASTSGSRPLLPEAALEDGRSVEDLLSLLQNTRTSSRHWLVLLSFCMNTAFNSFLSVNFAVVEKVTRETLHCDKDQAALFYTGFLLTVAIGMFPGLLLVTNYEGFAIFFCSLSNVSAAWVRWLGLRSRSYGICLISAVLNAAGAWVILPMPAQLSQQRFPPAWWTFTTSLAIQANYTGWLLGSIIPPNFIEDSESMERFTFVQAIASLPVFLAFFLFYRPPKYSERLAGENSRLQIGASFLSLAGETPFDDEDRAASISRAGSEASVVSGGGSGGGGGHTGGHTKGSLKQFVRTLRRYPKFGMQVLAYGALGGISFAFPGADDALLGSPRHNFSSKTVAVANAAFLGVGIASGLLLGANCKARNYGKVLKTLFVVATVALSSLAALAAAGAFPNSDPRPFTIVLVLFGFIGMTSIGFIGLGIEAAALYPAGGAYVCFTIEGMVQVVGAILNFYANEESGFAIIASVSWIATLLLLFGYNTYPAHRHGELEVASGSTYGDTSRRDMDSPSNRPRTSSGSPTSEQQPRAQEAAAPKPVQPDPAG